MDGGGEKSGDKGRSSNDQRADVKNPNNPDYKANADNRANQLNPNNSEYQKNADKGGSKKWVIILDFNPLTGEQRFLRCCILIHFGAQNLSSLPFEFTLWILFRMRNDQTASCSPADRFAS